MTGIKRGAATIAILLVTLLVISGCTETVKGTAIGDAEAQQNGYIDTDKFGKLLECTIVPELDMLKATGVSMLQNTFVGAICRWETDGGVGGLTLTWYEWGTMRDEQRAVTHMGYTIETVTIADNAAFVATRPDHPNSCGATANSPRGGVLSWWAEGIPDPCTGAKKLLELTLKAAL